jgi:hypothetical protein
VSDGPETPPLTLVTTSLALITAIRAAIAVGALAGLLAVFGNDEALRLAFAGGAGVIAVRHFTLRERADPWPAGAQPASWVRMVARAAYPSTIGLAALIAIAAPIEATLAALLAGFELGLAVMSVVLAAENGYWERRAGVTIAVAGRARPRYFARLRGSAA